MTKGPTRKYVARAQRDQRARTALIVTAVTVTVLVVGLVGYGLLRTRLIDPTQPVAVVNGEAITADHFQARVRFAQLNLLNQIQSLQQILQFFDPEDALAESYQRQLDDTIEQLNDPLALGSLVLNQMVDEILVEEEANRRGIQVTEGDIDLAIAEAFGYYPQGTPTPASEVPTATPAEAGATPLPTATPYTEQAFQALLNSYLGSLETIGVDESALREQASAQLYQQRLQQAFEQDVPRLQEHVRARHILVETEEGALEVLSRLDAGEDWEALALELSIDQSNREEGGNLGWFPRGAMVEPFEAAAFATQVGEVAGPVESAFGWHVIEVLERADREIEEPVYQQLAFGEFQDWLQSRRSESDIAFSEDWVDQVPDPPGA